MKTFFSGAGLDRADLVRSNPEQIAELRQRADARALQWIDGAPALGDDGRVSWQTAQGAEPLFLGFDDGRRPCFSLLPNGSATIDGRAHFGLIGLLDDRDGALFAAALSLANWHRRHGFCSVCGQLSRVDRGGWSRHCDSCGGDHFPRVDPVVIMLTEHDGRLLLGRQPAYPPGRYSALAGFVEVGETIEAAVAREMYEEAGIEIADVRYLASQPWPFPSSLMIGCTSRALDDRLTIDMTELDDARWFTRAEVENAIAGGPDPAFLPPPRFAIARSLIDHWLGDA
ncbi:MAG: NAD(+) diphosphatase [Sphingomicrobium sp.]